MSEDAHVMEHLRPLATRDACDAWIDFQISHQSAHCFCLWAVESRASGIFLGAVGLLRAHVAPAGSVLVLDSPFLHRPELRDIWDFSIFLDAPFDVTIPRGAARGPG
jgi:hypothetical protein